MPIEEQIADAIQGTGMTIKDLESALCEAEALAGVALRVLGRLPCGTPAKEMLQGAYEELGRELRHVDVKLGRGTGTDVPPSPELSRILKHAPPC